MNNTFIIDSKELKYKITRYYGEDDDRVKTEFYETYTIKKRKKWILFGEEREIIIPNTMFTIWEDFHSVRLPKEYWKREIRKKLTTYESLKAREDEIKNGEFV